MSQLNVRSLVYPVVAILIVGALVYLKPSRGAGEGQQDTMQPPGVSSGPGTEEVARLELPFRAVRSVPLLEPPHGVKDRLTSDPVERWAERLLWAPPDLVVYTQHQIAGLPEADQRRFLEVAWEHWRRDPLAARNFITTVAQFKQVDSSALIAEAAVHSSALLRTEATRALAILSTPEAALRMEKLLYDSSTQVKRGAIQSLIEMVGVPESVEVLRRYAETDPEEGLRHVIYRLRHDLDAPEAVAVVRGYLDRPDVVGWAAVEGLCVLGDPLAMDRAYTWLSSPSEADQMRAITYLAGAPAELLDADRLVPALSHRRPEVRRTVAELLRRMSQRPDLSAAEKERFSSLLLELSHDPSTDVFQIALSGLYALGRTSVVERYLKDIETTRGKALHNSVDVAVSLLGDPRAVDVILRRFDDASLDSSDRGTLISALCNSRDVRALPKLLEVIRRARPDEPRDSSDDPLSFRVAHQITTFGKSAQAPLLALLCEADLHTHAYLRTLDALRGIEGVDCLEELLDLATNPEVDLAVRRAALESMPFVKGRNLFDALMEVLDEFDDHELSRSLRLVLADYS